MNRLHLYMGEGKGKTSAAMGLALRALGRGRNVLVAQFMKSGTSGELLALREIAGCEVFDMPPPGKFSAQMSDAERAEYATRLTGRMGELTERVMRIKPGLTVLDELALMQQLSMVPERMAKSLIEVALLFGEVAVTGHHAPTWLIERSDYVSDIKKVRHPFDQGLSAREGVEF